MDITKARKLVELEKDGTKVLVTYWESGQISSCIEAEKKKFCENCAGDEESCNAYIEHLKGLGYLASEVEIGELDIAASLPKFLEQRDFTVKPAGGRLTVEESDAEPGADQAVLASPEPEQS